MLPVQSFRVRLAALVIFSALGACSESPPVQSEQAVPAGITQPAERIVTLAPHLTELVYAAGAGDKLVGAVEYSDYPPAALSVPRVGDAFRIDFELLRGLQPDLVLVWGSGNPAEMQRRLQELGFPVLSLEPGTLNDVAEHLRLVGRLAGTGAVADAAASDYLARLEATFTAYSAEPQLRVFFQISADPWYTVNNEHVISRIISRCGGINIFGDIGTLAPSVSLESIVAGNPDVIIASSPTGDESWKVLWQRFEKVPAVQNGRLLSVTNDHISRSGTRLANGAETICHNLASYLNEPQS